MNSKNLKSATKNNKEIANISYNGIIVWEKQRTTQLIQLTHSGDKGEPVVFKLQDKWGNPLTGKTVNIRVIAKSGTGDINYNKTTDSDGKASLQLGMTVNQNWTNDLQVTATYAGDTYYKTSTVTGDYSYNLNEARDTELVLLTTNGYSGDSIIVGLRDVYGNHLANKTVNIRVQGNGNDINYNKTTSTNGQASLPIALDSSVWGNSLTITATYAGEEIYQAATVTGNYNYEVYETIENLCKTAAASTTSSVQSNYGGWYSISSIKTTSSWATYHLTSKVGSYPNPTIVTASNFGFNIPSNATITKVQARYMQKASSITSGNGISPNGAALAVKYGSTNYGTATGPTLTTSSNRPLTNITLSSSLTPSIVNSSSFSLTIDYPANTYYNPGYVYLTGVSIIITYKTPQVIASW